MEPMKPLGEESLTTKIIENAITFGWVVCIAIAVAGKNWPSLAACIYIVFFRIMSRDTERRYRRLIDGLISIVNDQDKRLK